MKKLILPLLLVSAPAFAQERPATVIIPTETMERLMTFMSDRRMIPPVLWDSATMIMREVQGCVSVQVTKVDRGECPAVTKRLAASKPFDPASTQDTPSP